MNESINKVDILGETRNVAFNAMWPVGVTYTQYPGQKSPAELWPTAEYGCTWEEQKYGGAFFRTEGGNAKTFEQCSVSVVTSDKLNFTFAGSDPGNWAVGNHVIVDGEDRTIAAAITNGFRVSSAFTTSKPITNVIVLQNDENKRHNHSYKDFSEDVLAGTMNFSCYNIAQSGTGAITTNTVTAVAAQEMESHLVSGSLYPIGYLALYHTHTHSFTINDSGTDETRPVNLTIRIWRRIA